MPIRLHTPEEKPEDRQDFKHPNLLNWVADNRPRLAVAAITILRAYFVAGCPKVDSTKWGSFESWTAIIRGAIVWTGLACPLSNRQHANRSDESRTLLGLLITGLVEAGSEKKALTSSELESVENAPALTEAIKLICPTKFNSRAVAQKLKGFRGRRWAGWEIDSQDGHGGVKKWYAKRSSGGIGGIVSNPSYMRTENQIVLNETLNAHVYTDGAETIQPIQPSTISPVVYEVEV